MEGSGLDAVVVTGAGGRTGSILVRKLVHDSRRAAGDEKGFAYKVVAVVRSDASKEKLWSALKKQEEENESSKAIEDAEAAGKLKFVLADVTSKDAPADKLNDILKEAGSSVGLAICTSAMPQLNFMSLPGAIFGKIIGNKNAKPSFSFAVRTLFTHIRTQMHMRICSLVPPTFFSPPLFIRT